jgi:enoyl-CoA hydratase/carnithine racemase
MRNYQHIKLEVSDKVAWIIFNRPDQLNAMNALMMNEIVDALEKVNTMPGEEASVCVITGEGKAFMAGADIKEYAQQTSADFDTFQTKGRSLYATIEGNSKPVIAAVNGYAFGGGFEIALACDMMVASAYAKFALPEIGLNLIPGGGGTQRLPQKLGINLANELLMTGKVVTADWLLQRGLVNHVYAKEADFRKEVIAFTSEMTNKKADRLQALKQLTQASIAGVQTAVLSLENAKVSEYYMSDAGQEKIQAFYQKSLNKKK